LKLASNLALLVGNAEAQRFERREILPWGSNRYLAFHVKHSC
jgi:hypothetical protein